MMALWTTVKTSSILRLYAQCDEILFEGAFQIHFHVLNSRNQTYLSKKKSGFYMLKILLFHAGKLLSFVELKDKK